MRLETLPFNLGFAAVGGKAVDIIAVWTNERERGTEIDSTG